MKYTFETALVYLKRGYKIRRSGWDEKMYIYLREGDIHYFNLEEDNGDIFFDVGIRKFNNQDILAEDWEVVE